MAPHIYTIAPDRPFLATLAQGLLELAGGDPLSLGETVAMVAHQHRAKLANLWASAAILDNPPERHFGEIAADGIREKHRRGCC